MRNFPELRQSAVGRLGLLKWALGASLALAAATPVLAQTAPGGADQLGGQLASNGSTVSFRLFSQNATRVEVWLYAQAYGGAPVAHYLLSHTTGSSLWQLAVPAANLKKLGFDISPDDPAKLFTNVYYGYRVWGPNWTYSSSWAPGSAAGFNADVDSAGNRFNPNKLLLDPYALEVTHDHTSNTVSPALDDATLFASGPGDRLRDSGAAAPKGVVAMPFGRGFAALDSGTKPAGPSRDDVIYEAHLRGLSKSDPDAGACAGTYAGAVSRIPYLQQLGITAIELMPILETENEGNDLDDPAMNRSSTSTSGDNYWGYMTTSFFAPDRRYACDKSIGGPTREFATMVKAFHAAGIKVIADVVYNHTGEGGTWSSTDPAKANLWSFRGIDNASYYLLTRAPGTSTDRAWYYDITGTGNTMNTHHPRVAGLIIDSLNYQRQHLGVDGFRFDLGIALANTYDNDSNPGDPQRFYFSRSDSSTAMAQVVAAMPGVFLSSEPWGLAPNGQGYQQGNMPVGISEWNGAWRDVIRRAQNKYGVKDGDATRGKIATRVAGSSDLFGDPGDGRNKPEYAVNFLNVHDGFTLHDLYACSAQDVTQPWPLGPSDGGSSDEDQWDNGGDALLQRQQARTGFALLMLSAGVPIFNAGDEFLHSVNCNNNAYNVDSTATWLEWSWNVDQQNFQKFAQALIAFRKAQPGLHPSQFYSSTDTNGNYMAALDWFGADKSYRTSSSDGSWWNATSSSPDATGQNRTIAWRYDGSELGGGDLVLVLYNGEPGKQNFTLPWTGAAKSTWCRVTDTASWAEGPNQVDLSASSCVGGENTVYGVNGRSLVILIAK